MADEPRVIQPLVIMTAPTEPSPGIDGEADRFIEDLTVPSNLTFQEWVAVNRPLPPLELVKDPTPLLDDVPD